MIDTLTAYGELMAAAAIAKSDGLNLEPVPAELAEKLEDARRENGTEWPCNSLFSFSMTTEGYPEESSSSSMFYNTDSKTLYWETSPEAAKAYAAQHS